MLRGLEMMHFHWCREICQHLVHIGPKSFGVNVTQDNCFILQNLVTFWLLMQPILDFEIWLQLLYSLSQIFIVTSLFLDHWNRVLKQGICSSFSFKNMAAALGQSYSSEGLVKNLSNLCSLVEHISSIPTWEPFVPRSVSSTFCSSSLLVSLHCE